jgi:hypothetical protein
MGDMSMKEVPGASVEVIGFLNQALATEYADDVLVRNTTQPSNTTPMPSDEMIAQAKKYIHKGIRHGSKIKIAVHVDTLNYIQDLFRISKRYKIIDKVFTVPMFVDNSLAFGVVAIKASHHKWKRFKIINKQNYKGRGG